MRNEGAHAAIRRAPTGAGTARQDLGGELVAGRPVRLLASLFSPMALPLAAGMTPPTSAAGVSDNGEVLM